MEKLYYVDTYQKSTTCTVTQVTRTEKALEVLTDRTIFYPECGGQPGDCGTLGPHKVLDTRKAPDGSSILILDPSCPISKADALDLVLDWGHRYKYMVMHTCQHLISGTLFNLFNIGTVAVHLGEEYLTVETDQSSIETSVINSLVQALNREIGEGHDIIYHELDHKSAEELGMRRSIKVEGDVRIVEIQGIDRIACGGVHVRNTNEIRLVNYLYQEQIRGHVRLYFRCGEQALEDSVTNSRVILELSHILNCKTEELPEKVRGLQTSLTDSKAQASEAQKSLVNIRVKESLDENGLCCIFAPEGADLQHYAQCVLSYNDMAMLVLCPEEGRTRWLIALKGRYEKLDFKTVRESLLSKVGAKGGGRPPVYQGTAQCTDKAALSILVEDFRDLALSSQKA